MRVIKIEIFGVVLKREQIVTAFRWITDHSGTSETPLRKVIKERSQKYRKPKV